MLSLKRTILGAALGAAVVAAGCGGQGDGGTGGEGGITMTGNGGSGGGNVQHTTGDYQPLKIGATWTYHVDDKGVKYDKTVAVEAFEDLGAPKAGVMAYRSKTTQQSETQLTWYEPTGDRVVRHHEQDFDTVGAMKSDEWYDPYRLRVDESEAHLVVGASWDWTYADTKTTRSKPQTTTNITESWKVDGVDEPVNVEAGAFAALRLTHVDPTDASTKTYWFVRGVGKVREETSSGHIEELASYQIPQ
jgi:hypothetical protein